MIKYDERSIAKYFRKQGAQIGQDCYFQIHSLSTEPYLISIGNHVYVSRGVMFHTHNGAAWIAQHEYPDIRVCGRIVIEDNCFIGIYSHLLPDIRIGENSVIGAGSVVISDVPPNSVVMGVPARVISSTKMYKEKCIALWTEQKPPDDLKIDQNQDWFSEKNFSTFRRVFKDHLIEIFERRSSQ